MRILALLAILALSVRAFAQAPVMLTREHAGQLLMQALQAGQFPTSVVVGLSSSELPAGFEVLEYDWETLSQLTPQEKDYPTMTRFSEATWFGINTPYDHAYLFGVRFEPLRTEMLIRVNAWTGFIQILPSPRPEDPLTTNSQMGLGNLPILSLDQQRERALQIARTILGHGTFIVRAVFPLEDGERVSAGEWGTEFLVYKIDPSTGACLPQMARLLINSRTGWMEQALIYNRPLRVSTIPSINWLQAMYIAQSYLTNMGLAVAEWVTHYPMDDRYSELGMPWQFDFGLFVVEDGLLEQHLVWMLPCIWDWQGRQHAGLVGVNAHTGEVMTDVSAALKIVPIRQRKSWQLRKEVEIFGLEWNGSSAYLWLAPMHLVGGRVYIQSRYADNFGVDRQHDWLVAKSKKVHLHSSEKLQRNGVDYVSLRRLCEVAGIRIHWDNQRKIPVLYADWLDVKTLLKR